MQPYWKPEYDLTPKEWNAVVNMYQVLQDHNPSFYNIDVIVDVYKGLRDIVTGKRTPLSKLIDNLTKENDKNE